MRKNNSEIKTLLIVLLVIIVILIFILSFGSLNPSNIEKIPQVFKDNKEEAKRKHERLLALIEKQKFLKIKLDKKFKRIYFLVRLGLILIWIAALSVFYFIGFIDDLGDALNYSEASIILIIVVNFLTFGTLANLENYLDLIKTKTENWIYGKYINIDDKIESNKEKLTLLGEELNNS